MKNLVRGGLLLTILSMVAVIIYAQVQPEENDLIIANNSQLSVHTDTEFDNANNKQEVQKDDKKLVAKTGSSKATSAGVSKGSFSATAYCLQGKTAMGHGVRRGIIAADPRVVKLGSKIVVNAGTWSGTYLVSDTGGAIKGKKLDIWVPSCAEARKFGRRTVQVYAPQ
jgi:3D (Asp-Asp-Asp) domain-containing protein